MERALVRLELTWEAEAAGPEAAHSCPPLQGCGFRPKAPYIPTSRHTLSRLTEGLFIDSCVVALRCCCGATLHFQRAPDKEQLLANGG